MTDEQTALSWLAIVGLFIAVWLVYKPTLTAIIFGPTESSASSSDSGGLHIPGTPISLHGGLDPSVNIGGLSLPVLP